MRRAICPICQRVVAVYRPTQYAPKDGSDVYRAHRNRLSEDCDGVARAVHPVAYIKETS